MTFNNDSNLVSPLHYQPFQHCDVSLQENLLVGLCLRIVSLAWNLSERQAGEISHYTCSFMQAYLLIASCCHSCFQQIISTWLIKGFLKWCPCSHTTSYTYTQWQETNQVLINTDLWSIKHALPSLYTEVHIFNV